jgi:hypothetical protein
MATVITAGNATNGLSLSADNFGALEFKTGTGAGTTALTLSSSQIATFAGAASIPGNLSFNSGYGSAAVAYGCRAWVNFNGTNTVAIRASGNVTSITDNGVGLYTLNFTTAMTDANYAAVFGGQGSAGSSLAYVTGRGNNATLQQTTTTLNISTSNGANAAADPLVASVAIFR